MLGIIVGVSLLWLDEDGEVFVKITRRELMKKLGIRGSQKMSKIMDVLKAFGLIFEERLGFGRCNKIFLCDLKGNSNDEDMDKVGGVMLWLREF